METFPTLDFGPIERHGRIVLSQTLEKGKRLFLKNGALIVKNAFSPEHLEQLYNEYISGYSDYLQGKIPRDARVVGDKRLMFTVEFEGAFNDPEIYANPFIFPLLSHLLGQNLILGGFGSVVSFPGADEQHVHSDLPDLFGSGNGNPRSGEIKKYLPPYAITAFVPLVPVTSENGATRMWLGSHLVSEEQGLLLPFIDPVVEFGDVILFDYRILHGGLPNQSNKARPVLFGMYSRPWFRDYQTCRKQVSIKMSEGEFSKVPESHKGLFDLSRQVKC